MRKGRRNKVSLVLYQLLISFSDRFCLWLCLCETHVPPQFPYSRRYESAGICRLVFRSSQLSLHPIDFSKTLLNHSGTSEDVPECYLNFYFKRGWVKNQRTGTELERLPDNRRGQLTVIDVNFLYIITAEETIILRN